MDGNFIKAGAGLVPSDELTREWFAKLKPGSGVAAECRQPRNKWMHDKWFALVHLAFDYWSETATPVEYKGQQVSPDFERFRKDVTVLAGKFHYVTNLRGEVRAEADSISFGSMSQETFDELYGQTLSVLMTRVFTGPQWSEARVQEVVGQVASFA